MKHELFALMRESAVAVGRFIAIVFAALAFAWCVAALPAVPG